MNDKKAFLVYTEWIDLIEVLPDEEQLILFKRMFRYERGEEYKITCSRSLEKLWDFVKKKLDEAEASSERIRQKRSQGGKTRQNQLRTAKDSLRELRTPEINEGLLGIKENVNVNVNVKENVNVNSKESTKEKRFIPPTVDEIEQFILDSGYSVDAEAFHDFYSMKNWMIGKNKMKDWKAAVRLWHRRNAKPVNDFLTAFDRGELT